MGRNFRPLAVIAAAGMPHLAAGLDRIVAGPADFNRMNTEWTRRQLGDSRDV